MLQAKILVSLHGSEVSARRDQRLRRVGSLKLMILAAIFSAVISVTTASAQSAPDQSATAGALLTRNIALTTLQSLAAPMPLPSGISLADPAALIDLETAQLMRGSQAAKAFYSTYPADPFAAQARKLEATLALQSVQLGNRTDENSALGLASGYLANLDNPEADRFDVALSMSVLSDEVQKTRLVANAKAYADLADTLQSEFGDASEVFHLYVGILRTVDTAGASAVAKKVLTLNAPDWEKQAAQAALMRQDLVGLPLNLTLLTFDGKTVDLMAPYSKPTIVFVWSNRAGTGDLTAFGAVRAVIPEGVRVIYVSLQSDLSTTDVAVSQAPVPGLFCFDKAGFDGLLAHTLGAEKTPCVYVLNVSGNVVGIGGLEDLGTLLAAAGN